MTSAQSSILLVAICAFFAVACSSPRSEFEDELDEKFDELVEHLEAYADGDTSTVTEGTATWSEGGQLMMNPDVSMPMDRSALIISRAEDIEKHFTHIPFSFLEQDPDDFEAWAGSFRYRYDARCAEVSQLLKRIEEEYQSGLYEFSASSSLITAALGGVGLSRDDRLYFRRGNDGYYIDALIYVDFETWIPELREEIEKRQ
jgi:hypothetical protein